MIRIAFYGKGGIGKSTTVSNLTVHWADQGFTVLQIGCDPKADSTISLRRGSRIPTVMDMVRSREPFELEDVVFVREARGGGRILCAEAGGPMPGQGCAGRGIITALETLREKGILEKYSPDIILYDVLGDVVCGGFAMPMREGYADRVYVLTSGENMSIYAAANIGLAVQKFKERGYAGLGGLILNRRNVKREEEKVLELAQDLGTEITGAIDRSGTVTEAEEIGRTVMEAFPESETAASYRALADRIAEESGIVYPGPSTEEEPAQHDHGYDHPHLSQPLQETDGAGARRCDRQFGAQSRIPAGRAGFPVPFTAGLEFNPPVHETWNIVHIGMLFPQSHQIYICSDNCMRGVVMTAAEMNAIERFSCVVLEESDIHNGNLEEITLEGVTDVLGKLRRRKGEDQMPRAVLVFPVCLHHFTGCDLRYVYRELEKRFPEIVFLKCWMDPIMQKTGPTPDQKLRKAMMDVLGSEAAGPGQKTDSKRGTALLGDIYALDEDSELMRLIRAADRKYGVSSVPLQIQDCRTLKEYGKLAERETLITRSPLAAAALRQTARRIGSRALYLPAACRYEEILSLLTAASQALGISLKEAGIDPEAERSSCERALTDLKARIGNTPVALDAVALQRPVGFARLLLEHGIRVKEIYLDAVSAEEEQDFKKLAGEWPEVLLCSTIRVEGRVLHADALGKDHSAYLAVGPKAAWFSGTRHFVNMVDYAGMWGFSGIRKMAALMEDAFISEKDTRDIVPRKGLGCESMLL